MKNQSVSVASQLMLIPSKTVSFIRDGSKIYVSSPVKDIDVNPVPGSVKIATMLDKGVLKKKITFEISDVNVATDEALRTYSAFRFVALYTDERGYRRVCGSPSFPLKLEFVPDDTVYAVTLTGEDTAGDGFFAEISEFSTY